MLALRIMPLRLTLLVLLAAGCDGGCMHTGTTAHLTELNWNEEVELGSHLIAFVEFSSPWCIYSGTHSCDDMTQAWIELGEEYKDHPDILIGEVDCSRWPGIDANNYSIKGMCQYHNIREYPTVRSFNPAFGPHGRNYTGPASIEGLKKFVSENEASLCKLDETSLLPNDVCDDKEKLFAVQWKDKGADAIGKELKRLGDVFHKEALERVEPTKLLLWMGKRINLLHQLIRVMKERRPKTPPPVRDEL